jgi:hypothetical protein
MKYCLLSTRLIFVCGRWVPIVRIELKQPEQYDIVRTGKGKMVFGFFTDNYSINDFTYNF